MRTLPQPLYALLLSILLSTVTIAQEESFSAYTLQLNHRLAEDIMHRLRPFLHPDGIMTGEGYKILLKTTEQNFRDLQQFVAELDVTLRQLRISVTVDSEQALADNRLEDSVSAKAGSGEVLANMNVKRYSSGRRDKSALTQQLQVLEGKWATISTGESVPVGQRSRNPDGTVTESVTYRDITSGFQVLPRVNGEQVTLFIRPQLDRPHHQGGGRIQTRRAETTLTGKLNQWILIGGAAKATIDQHGSRVYSTGQRTTLHNQIFVKVEIVQ